MAKRTEVVRQLREYEASTEVITAAFEDEQFQELASKARDGATLFKYLNENFSVNCVHFSTVFN